MGLPSVLEKIIIKINIVIPKGQHLKCTENV